MQPQEWNKAGQIFRLDTFGDQAFWGDTLKLHQAIEGAGQNKSSAGAIQILSSAELYTP